MRSLTSTLQTAINSSTRRPALTLTAEDHIQHFTLYQSPGNPDAYSDAVVAPDKSIIRAQVTRNGFTSTAQFQRITNPSVASQWVNWTNLPGGVSNCFQDGGVAISVNGSTIRIFAQQGTGGNALWNWYSTNNGQTWNSPEVVLNPPGGALIKGIASAGNNDVFFIYDISGGEAIGASFHTTGWSALNTWTLATISGGSGLAAWYGVPGISLVYTIVYSDGYSLKQCTYNPLGSVWSNTQVITPTTSTAIGRIAPKLSYDGATQLMTLACIEQDSGFLTGSVYSYPRLRQSLDMIHWSNGLIVHGLSSNYGVNVLALPNGPNSGSSGAQYYVIGKASVFAAPMYAQSNTAQYLDLSNAVLSYKRTEKQNKTARLDVLIDNNKGVYSSKVCTGSAPYAPIGPNTMLVLSEGYVTTNGREVINTGRYHIQQIVFERSPDENRIHIVAHDMSRNLDVQSRFQLTYLNQTVSWLVTEVCVRAGLFATVVPPTAQTSQAIPSYTIHAGQTYRQALDELAGTYDLVYFLDQFETMQFVDRATSVGASWTYKPEIEIVAFGTDDLRANHIIVNGKPPTGGQAGALTTNEAYDDAHISLVGLERVIHHTDQKLTSTTQCSSKASFLIAEEQRAQIAHHVIVPANPGLQLLDVITLNDFSIPTGAGQSGTVRIIESVSALDAQNAHYEQSFALEGQ